MSANDSPHRAETALTFVRHTDVENPEEIFYGRMGGYGLTALGREQAERTSQALAGLEISAIYTSPMLRARQTARILAKHHGISPRATWLLAEVRTAWQGKPFAELDKIGFDFYSNPVGPAEESLDAIWQRVRRFTCMATERHPGDNVLAVTHGDICMVARAGFLGLPIEVASIRLPHLYAGKGSLTRVNFGVDPSQPPRVDYYDPNGDDPRWASGWVTLDAHGARVD